MTSEDILKRGLEKIDEDLKYLMDAFAQVLENLGEGHLARLLPWRGQDLEKDVSPTETREQDVAGELQLLSVAFQLLNLVEENSAAQMRRLRESEGLYLYEPGLWGQNLRQLKEAGLDEEQIAEAFSIVNVEPVLTAHPTEAKRPVILEQHRLLYTLMEERENPIWTPAEQEEIGDRIKVALERIWRTGEIYLKRPDVSSELENIIYYLKNVFPSIIPKIDKRLRLAWREMGFDPKWVQDHGDLPRISFGNWVGGDRDGHKFVTAEVTRQTLENLRDSALEVQQRSLESLYRKLPLSGSLNDPPKEFLQDLDKTAREIGEEGLKILARDSREPWRQFVKLMLHKLPFSDSEEKDRYSSPEDLAADFEVLRESLMAVGADRLVHSDVVPAERLLDVFGFHLAALDIRQNSSYHDRAVGQILWAAGIDGLDFAEWPEEKRLDFLNEELKSARPFAPTEEALGEEARAVLDCYKVVHEYRRRRGGRGLGSLIVSMTRSLSDLLVVYILAREARLARAEKEGLVCHLPVVPLFETIEDLDHAPDILEAFLDHPVTRASHAHIHPERPVQQVMIGYSDSNKDGGYLTSLRILNRAQWRLTKSAERQKTEICFFHGRGGTTSRGAGPTHRFLEALPHSSLTGNFRVTEQGESIAQKYGNTPTALYNLELMMAGVTATTLRHKHFASPREDLFPALDKLSEFSQAAYRRFIKRDGFMEYWSHATPIDVLERSSIGSRPARRTGRRTLEDLRAIPWVFSWYQSRHYFPGWFGVGSGLERLQQEDPKGFQLLVDTRHEFSFLRYVLYNAETNLVSASRDLMQQYASLVENEEVRNDILSGILEEYERTERMIDTIYGAPRAKRRPRMIKTILERDSGLHRLHLHQIHLLREWRTLQKEEKHHQAEEMFPTILLSVNAIAAGLRTTG